MPQATENISTKIKIKIKVNKYPHCWILQPCSKAIVIINTERLSWLTNIVTYLFALFMKQMLEIILFHDKMI